MSRNKKKAGGDKKKSGPASIQNRKARHDYHIIESVEAGIVLRGSEVKSIRDGKISLKDAYARIRNGEAWLSGSHISPYKNLNSFELYNPIRERKLLLHKKQIFKLTKAVKEKGLTLVPLKIYFKGSLVKLELGVGKGKKMYDKRYDLKEKDAKRDIDRAMKQ